MTQLSTSGLLKVAKIGQVQGNRGRLIEPVADQDLRSGQVLNLHVVTLAPGTTRGNHVHPQRTETICVLGGNLRARFWDDESGASTDIEVNDGDSALFTVSPGVAHAFQNIGATTGYLLCYADRAYDPGDVRPKPLL